VNYRVALTAFVALALTTTATAQDEQLLFAKGGAVYHGVVLSSDAGSATIKLRGEEETYKVDRAKFDPHCFYTIRDKALGDDAAGRIELAKFCVDNDLFSRAKVQMDRARQIDEKVVDKFMETEFPKIKEGLAERVMASANRAFQNGSMKNAHSYASLVLTKFGGTKCDAQAEAMLTKVQAKIDADQEKKRAQRRKSAERNEEIDAKQAVAKRDSLLAPIEKAIDSAEKANNNGLTAKNLSKQKAGLESAASKYVHAMKQADAAVSKTQEPDLQKALGEMSATAKGGAIQAYLNLANVYSSRGNYVKGTEYCNKALAIDPENAEAKSARATISTTTGGWGRRGGGRRR